MKVINKTQYDTRYLRKLFLACEKRVFQVYLKRDNYKLREVTVKSGRTPHVRGYAWYNSYSIVMLLPPPISTHWGKYKHENKVFARRIAQVYLHEVGHNLNLKHKQMVSSLKIDVSWWPEEIVPLKPTKEKPKTNIIEKRAEKAQKKLDEWQQKLKRTKTYIKKYQRKVKYYSNKMAASN